MLRSKDYRRLINSISNAVVVLSPVYNSTDDIHDFCICFINRPNKELFRGYIKSGQKISDLKSPVLPGMDWLTVCTRVITENISFKTSYYSPVAQTYLYVTAQKFIRKSKFCIMTFTDLSAVNTLEIPFFHPQVHTEYLLLQNRLEQAAEENNFELHFQPQFIIQTNELRGFEALLRWSDNVLGQVNPDDFIPVAEQNRSIVKIGYWVLETAVQTLKYWQETFNFKGIMSVNISPVQLEEADFTDRLFTIIRQYDIRPDSLELEVTESVLIQNIPKTVRILNILHLTGIRISLDDFGTGYCSFRYLQFLPVTTIKIDKSFINGLTSENKKESVIADTVVSLAEKLGLETIAEGVEYPAQLDVLKKIGCTTVQGFLSGKPMASGQCGILLNSHNA
ncbi:MAG: EAL domain-containing protein [Treponema sp.]|nr:EAL domain-containing protein [Treponema sp.]